MSRSGPINQYPLNNIDPIIFKKPKFTQQHVGGKNKLPNQKEYIKIQSDLLNDLDKKLPPNIRRSTIINTNTQSSPNVNYSTYNLNVPQSPTTEPNPSINARNVPNLNRPTKKTDRYDPYEDYLYKRGLTGEDTIRRFKTNYLNIDSAYRVKDPFVNLDDIYTLPNNPIDFNQNSKTIFINHPQNPYQIGDLIVINNVFGKVGILRSTVNLINSFNIILGTNVMAITYTHGLDLSIDTTNLYLTILGVEGDVGNPIPSYLGNIPINLINTTHQLKLSISASDVTPAVFALLPPSYLVPNPNTLYVILPLILTTAYTMPSVPYNYTLEYLFAGGVPINYINANYPINASRLQGYQVITSVTENGYFIDLKLPALYDINDGGNQVSVAKILEVNPGYQNPNSYSIDLGEGFHDIISARVISTEFPNTDYTIRDYPLERANNKIYWNDINDGDYLYSISVPTGNYTPLDLITVMENLFLNTPRINNSTNNSNITYENNHFMKVTINTNTNVVNFQLYKQYNLCRPFGATDPVITPGTPTECTNYILTITHPNSGVNVGDTILISGAIVHQGIPSTVLNGVHTVYSIIDADNYTIQLPRFNLLDLRENTGGGTAVSIFIPDTFRLLFNFPDTLGSVLGFRNPGDENSYYAFAKSISNSDQYQFESTTNAVGQTINITNNFLDFSGDNYVLMLATPLSTLASITPTKYAFAKIQLSDIPGKVLYNTFAPTSAFYDDPIHEVFNLTIQFYTPDGYLFEFHGIDHSFTIEIVSVSDIPRDTGIDPNTGKNYNLEV